PGHRLAPGLHRAGRLRESDRAVVYRRRKNRARDHRVACANGGSDRAQPGFLLTLLGVVDQRLFEQLTADADIIERPVIVRDIAGVYDARTFPVLLCAPHLQDPHFELAIRPHATNPREWSTT